MKMLLSQTNIYTINLETKLFLNKERVRRNGFSLKHQSNIKMLWSGIRSIMNIRNKSKLSLISQLKYNGTCVNDPPPPPQKKKK